MNPKDKHADWLLKPTANELADEVEMWGKDLLALNMKGGIPVIEGAKLLRQQQAEIEALKQIIDANNLNQNIGQFVKPTNEPVAWIGETLMGRQYINGQKDELPVGTALYTHPVKEQDESFDRTASHMAGEYVSYKAELTDEEIDNVSDEVSNLIDTYAGRREFARAILRKAQEK